MADRTSKLPVSSSIASFPSISVSQGRARSYEGFSNLLGEVNDGLNDQLDRDAVAEAKRAGTVAGATGKPTLSGEATLAGEAFDRSARQSYATNIELQARTRLNELSVEHATNPTGYSQAAKAYLAGVAEEVGQVDKAMAALFKQKFALDVAKETQAINGVYSDLLADQREAEVLTLSSSIKKSIRKIIPDLFTDDPALGLEAMERLQIEAQLFEKSFLGIRPDGTAMFSPSDIAKATLDFEEEIFQQIGRGFIDATPDKQAALAAITDDTLEIPFIEFDDAGEKVGVKNVNLTEMLTADGKQSLIGYLNAQVTADNRAVQQGLRRTAEQIADLEIGIDNGSMGLDDVIAADQAGLFENRQPTLVRLTKAALAEAEAEATDNDALDKAGRDEKIGDLEIRIDNGTAGLQELMIAERGGLFKGNPAKRVALRKAWQTREEARLKDAGVLSDAEINDAIERQIADLDIAIKRGEAEEEDIEAADAAGLFDDRQGKRATLTKAIIARDAAATELIDGMTRVSQAVNGELFLDPKDGDDKKFVDAYYRDRVDRVAGLMEGQAPEVIEDVRKTLAVNMVASTGVIPKSLKGELIAAMRSGDNEQRASAADTIDRLNQIPGNVLADEMPKRDIALGLMISSMVRAGRSAQQAVATALASTDPANKPVIEARNDEIKAEKFEANYDGIVTGNFNPLSVLDFIPFGPSDDAQLITADGTKARVIDDYKVLFEDWYRRTGDEDMAEEQALIELNNVWGVTRVDSSVRVMKYAPEAYYGIGLDDHVWMRAQLLNDIKLMRPDLDEGSILLGSDNTTAREAKGRAPTYPVLIKTPSGAFEPLRLDGKLLRWNPDSQKPRSKVVGDAIQIAREARQEEIADRARLGEGSFGMLSEDIQRRRELEGGASE